MFEIPIVLLLIVASSESLRLVESDDPNETIIAHIRRSPDAPTESLVKRVLERMKATDPKWNHYVQKPFVKFGDGLGAPWEILQRAGRSRRTRGPIY
ncbi:hypothetical protein QR680_010772 [Steinernema hermaphroditum]|uniref:Uncharacterized protein n=1 Tax=Steinernema hermaphroditum TaxID=289476 RepID=A0AA39MC90_9BILA|nr:hypothetical protein QR680_010772 [Steinernema hermaphroditum]